MAAIVVAGIVVNVASNKGVGAVRVEIRGQSVPAVFATVTTDVAGEFRTPIGEQSDVIKSFGDHARILEFNVSRDGQAIPIKDGGTLPINNALLFKTVIKVEVAVTPPTPAPAPPQPSPKPDPNMFLVHGSVLQANGVPLIGATVHAFDQDMRTRNPLGNSVTDDEGAYAIPYAAQQFAAAESDTADLVLEVSNGQGIALKIARAVTYGKTGRASVVSGPIFNAPPDIRVDLLVDTQERTGLSEFEQLVALITPLTQDVAAADLTEEDIVFLSGDTTIDARFIRMFAVASKFARDLVIPAEAFYGLAREGLTLDLHVLARHGADTFRQALTEALRDSIVPRSLGNTLDNLISALMRAIAAHVLATPVADGVPALSAVLAAATSDSDDHAKFLSLYAAHHGSPEEFWKKLRVDGTFPNAVVDRIQTTLQLTVLTRGNVALAQQVMTFQQQQKMTTLRDLAKLDANDWLKLLPANVAGIPAGIEGDTDDEKRLNYARGLEADVDHAFPTAAIARRMAKEAAAKNSDVVTFLNENSDFDFDRTHVDSYLANNPKSLDGAKDRKATTARLKTLQRLFAVTPHYSEISVLAEDGMESARTVARMGPEAFVARFGKRLGDPARARELYDRSARMASIAASLFVKFAPAVNSVDFHATRRPQ